MEFSFFMGTLLICLRGSVSQDINADELIANSFGNQDEGGCECVPYYQCSTNKTFIENGEDIIDIRIKPEECHYLEVCCGTGDKVTEPITPRPPPQQPIPTFSACGQRNPQGLSLLRITGDVGGEAKFGEFPWMMAVTAKQPIEGSDRLASVYQCGGSLISPTFVLTAAHCVNNKTGLSVRAGEWDTQTNNEPLPLQISPVKEVLIHEEFRSGSLHNDIALLVLDKAMELDQHIGPICLPGQDENMDGRNCVASGWGKDVFGKEGRYQEILKKVEKQVVPKDQCIEALHKTRLGTHFKLHESFICAGGKIGLDTCKGDGGSPLVCPSTTDPKVYVQAGIVSWGIGCGTETPAVYVNVAHFANWIENKMSHYEPRQD